MNSGFSLGELNAFIVSMLAGWAVHADNKGIKLTEGEATVHFDVPVHTKEGVVWCTCCKQNNLKELHAVANDGVKVSLSKAHEWL